MKPDPKPLPTKRPRDAEQTRLIHNDLLLHGTAFVDRNGLRVDPADMTSTRRRLYRPIGLDGGRVIDREALAIARITGDPCAACGGPSGSVHHVVQRGSPHFGDDVAANLLLLCGSGSDGCHGAHHGSPYTATVERMIGEEFGRPSPVIERRDAEWVNRRIGETIGRSRPDTVAYVIEKIGSGAGRSFLERVYYLRVP